MIYDDRDSNTGLLLLSLRRVEGSNANPYTIIVAAFWAALEHLKGSGRVGVQGDGKRPQPSTLAVALPHVVTST
jgi:hypothetical protein